MTHGDRVRPNDIVVTSGTSATRLESLFPPNIPIGRVTRVDDLAGIELPGGVPDRLELAEALHELGAVHLRQELRLRLTVAVLAGDRAAVGNDQLGRLLDEVAVVPDAVGGFQLEVDACVDTALAEVAIQIPFIAEAFQ